MFYIKSCLSTFERTFPSVGGKITNTPPPLSPRPQCNSTKQSTTKSHLCMQELYILCRPFSLLFYHSCVSLPSNYASRSPTAAWRGYRFTFSMLLSLVVLQLLRCVSKDSQLLHLNFGPSIGDAELQDRFTQQSKIQDWAVALTGGFTVKAFCNL